MKNLFVLSLAVIISFSFFTSCGAQKGKQPVDMLKLNNENYASEWKTIDSLEQQGLPKSALEKVNALYEKVKSENDPAQVIKCLIYQGKYQSQLEEDGLVKAIYRMQQDMEAATFPVKPVLQSMLAEMYQQYLNQNYWRFRDRTTTAEFKNEDIQTWTVDQLVAASRTLYYASVENTESQNVNISDFAAILYEGSENEGLRPTLYDFLMHRAIDYLVSENNYVSEPAYKFYISQEEAFGSVSEFVNYKFATEDQESPKLKALLLFQKLLSFHQKDTDPAALIDANLKRLKFVYNNAVLGNKESLYEKALRNLEQSYATSTSVAEISYYLAQFYYEKGQNYTPNPDDKGKWDWKTAVQICDAAIKKHPDTYGAKQCKALKTAILQQQLTLSVEEVHLPDLPLLGLVSYQNIDKAYFKVAKITESDERRVERMDQQEKAAFLQKLDPLKTWSVALPDDGDYRNHSVEIKIDPLSLGRYIIISSTATNYGKAETAVQYLITHISRIAYQSRRGADGEAEFVLTDRQTGAPLQGVKAEFLIENYNSRKREYEYNKISEAVSDKDGFLSAKIGENRRFQVKFKLGDDELYLREGFSNYRDRSPQSFVTTHLFTDRSIYRPGQTIYFKGIVIEKDDKRLPSLLKYKDVTITFYDVNNQKVKELALKTNEFGSVSGTFVAPNNGLLGQMRIQSSAGNSSQYISVEEYKRPKFEVTFEPVEGSFKLKEQVTVKGQAKAYAGSNIDGAEVNYRIVREARFPYLPWWYWRGGWPSAPSMEIAFGTTKTNETGAFEITFEAIPDLSIEEDLKPEFVYTVYADVIDITGETHSNQKSISVGYIALNAGFNLTEKSNIDSLKSIKIYTQNLNGQKEPAKGTLMIQSLTAPKQTFRSRYWEKPDKYVMTKEEFYRYFPFDAYKDEDLVQNWPVAATLLKQDFDTDKSEIIDLKNVNFKPGKYVVTLNTQDKFGQKVEVKRFVTLYDLKSAKPPSNEIQFLVQEKNSFEPGEAATYYLGTAEESIWVLYEVEHDGKIKERKWLAIKDLQKLSYPVLEEHRGNLTYHLSFVKNNRTYIQSNTLVVPWSNKDLQIEYATFRDKLYPGQEEEWKIKISGPKKEKVAAEFMATMYDASLDELKPHGWSLSLYPGFYAQRTWRAAGFGYQNTVPVNYRWNYTSVSYPSRSYARLNWFNFTFYQPQALLRNRLSGVEFEMMEEVAVMSEAPAPAPNMADGDMANGKVKMNKDQQSSEEIPTKPTDQTPEQTDNAQPVQIRKNLKETVFFLPDLQTDPDGNVILKFTMNEALTRWKFMGLAHTQDLKFSLTQQEIVTQKDLMVFPNPPRFFREDDRIEFTAKVTNLTQKDLSGTAELRLFDALTNAPVDNLFGNKQMSVPFTAKAGQSARLAWTLDIPVGQVPVLTHQVIAKAGNFSDGEESSAPVLSNRMLVTETKPLPVRGNETRKFTFEAMKKARQSSTLQHHKFTLEFTSNPAWYAVQALPYLMEYPYDCTEQIFSRYYANSLATSVANSHPKIRQVFDKWKNTPAMLSNLSKNEELKTALLEETPWVLQAQSEEEQKKNIGLLFDLERMSREEQKAMSKIIERQLGNGGFAWFPGGRDDWYITQYIVEGLGHLDQLNVKNIREEQRVWSMVSKAVSYTDDRIGEHYDELKKRIKKNGGNLGDDHLDWIAIHYLYARSFFIDLPISKNAEEAMNYYQGQAQKYWLDKGMYGEGMIALALQRFKKPDTPAKIVKSLKERSLNHEELGMYWKYNTGYYWYQLPIETHALMIEVFEEVAKDAQAVDDLKVWLLKNKQTNHWKTTKATSSAVYALLRSGDNWLLEDRPVEITIGDKTIDQSQMETEAGTGYFKTSWDAAEIQSDMLNIQVKNTNKVVAWGAAYWQYFEQLDKITTFEETPLTLKKQLFKVENSVTGPVMTPINENSKLKPGDKIQVRIELRVDRHMEYVHLKDMRASGFEPLNVISTYKWQGGLGYYESTKDASTNFFMAYLPKGTHVFEYPLRVVHEGDFSNGISTIQCMYAPEFSSHSEGIRVQVGE